MKSLVTRINGGQKGFTLIELLVVIAILGVIAAVVALNVGGFFGRGTLQAANTELHQVQTAIIACMADGETGTLDGTGPFDWHGQESLILAGGGVYDGADYIYGPLRATYEVSSNGTILSAVPTNTVTGDGWGNICWDGTAMNWSDDCP